MDLHLRLLLFTSVIRVSLGCGDQTENVVNMCESGTNDGSPNFLFVPKNRDRELCSCSVPGKDRSTIIRISVQFFDKDRQKCESGILLRHIAQSAITLQCNSTLRVFEGLPINIDFVGSLTDDSTYCLHLNASSADDEFSVTCKQPQQLPPLPTIAVTTEIINSSQPEITMKATIISASVGGAAALGFVILITVLSCRRKRKVPVDKEDLTTRNGRAIGMETECESTFAEMSEIEDESQCHENFENISDDSFPPPPPNSGLGHEEEVTHFRAHPYTTQLGDIQEEVSYEWYETKQPIVNYLDGAVDLSEQDKTPDLAFALY